MISESGVIKRKIIKIIGQYVEDYQKRPDIVTKWKMPLVGFADAKSVEFLKLKEIVLPDHQTPQEILSDPSVVIAYFIPFTEPIGNSNRSIDGGGPSKEWSNAYHETNTATMY